MVVCARYISLLERGLEDEDSFDRDVDHLSRLASGKASGGSRHETAELPSIYNADKLLHHFLLSQTSTQDSMGNSGL